MRLSTVAPVVALLPFASAYITGIVQLKGTYKADQTTSMFPVTFSTGSTKVELCVTSLCRVPSLNNFQLRPGGQLRAEHAGRTHGEQHAREPALQRGPARAEAVQHRE